ncbi:BREX-2 system adenine-specific DNA-methyltransferase PglX [Streptosporangium sp. LJ11]|uniref:BREX-2 system adenine-specific DNA-methyltransferase PglX n=1 Tax=Streptosporangium sp. LJ11 TaxID=3436927 RepID=UPI003F793127
MINRTTLLADLRKQVGTLEGDLRTCATEDALVHERLEAEWEAARTASRTAATFEEWREGRITQAAVAWVLGTVFLRFCEDNRLIDLPYLAGPGERLDIAQERQGDFFKAHPEKTDRDWILAGFNAMAASPVVAGLFDFEHNPMWMIARPAVEDEKLLPADARWHAAATRLAGPSHPVAQSLLAFWRATNADRQIVHDFTNEDTRFLGDLYQDLSEHAKKTYALLQTPEFVEEFILDYTLTPALDEFREDFLNEKFRLIDPTCGSGHFLLGAFKRILAQWEQEAPGADRWDLIRRTLMSVHGIDKNPFASAVARFRLLIAALQAGNISSLTKAPEFPINIAVGDTLLFRHERKGQGGIPELDAFLFATEDVSEYVQRCDILAPESYQVVVGNPPYITVKDKTESERYRQHYETCAGTYALSIPFAERFFDLATSGGDNRRGAGYVGQITANSFMKREFGKKLIEEFFATKVELTHVIDTSGAYIPGHGTPTVIIIGRNQEPAPSGTVRAILGIRGEPIQPENPARGKVWQAIVHQVDDADSESDWVSASDLTRQTLFPHPWSLSGGGSAELVAHLHSHSFHTLQASVKLIGRTAHTGADESYFAPRNTWFRFHVGPETIKPLVEGLALRDWYLSPESEALFPYDEHLHASLDDIELARLLWRTRCLLRLRREPGGTHEEIGLTWYEWSRWHPERYTVPLGIAFPFVATHNHFVLDRGGKVFKQTAPVIKLPKGATEDEHLELLGVLNSSTACFWLKQVSYPKGGDPMGGEGARVSAESWSDRYEFTGTKVQEFPLPAVLPLKLGQELDQLAHGLGQVEPSAACAQAVPTRARLDAAQLEHTKLRSRMVTLQEELDWEVYRLYELIDDNEAAELCFKVESVPELNLGERAFEIVLARKMADPEFKTQWFARHGSTPITEIPAHWPEDYKRVVQKRIEIIDKRRDIALIERPECKRRWMSESWEKKEREALTTWLLDRSEARELWFTADEFGNDQPRPMTVHRLADKLRADADVVSVARLLKGPDADLADVLVEIVADEHVPYLAALRYKDTGLRKRAQWERTWDLQREEDATGERLNIPVPPKYTGTDFRKAGYWRNRGKLDVPKERFISYENAGSESDRSLLLGWAGWDQREQGYALMTLIEERTTHDLWEAEKLTPLIAGLSEVLPWVKQWHSDIDPEHGDSWANALTGYLEGQQLRYDLTDENLKAWRPAPTGRGRKKA